MYNTFQKFGWPDLASNYWGSDNLHLADRGGKETESTLQVYGDHVEQGEPQISSTPRAAIQVCTLFKRQLISTPTSTMQITLN